MSTDPMTEEKWRQMLNEGEPVNRHIYHLFGILPANPRCKLCAAPFRSWGGSLMRLIGREQSKFNPRFCQPCEPFGNPGGAEVVLTMLFADVRGSTTLADRLMGDEVIGLYIPGFAGKEHPARAITAARELLELTGHRDREGPWLPVGVGVHTGPAFVGIVGGTDDNPSDFTALGDNVNVTARLSAQAAAGEVLISQAAYEAASLDLGHLERRKLELKGKSGETVVRVLQVSEE